MGSVKDVFDKNRKASVRCDLYKGLFDENFYIKLKFFQQI